ncbi:MULTISPECIES: VOC family protein [unclassified Streptomyces]|uniref:VOC family protein n=1 Tax=unclassified Streptomyces TaxID=2593676 RepID=UPI002DD7B957|nr:MULTISPECIES: VOC family protein [unclassified Streptomyces]WSA94314.1 VOC family protein [Streptomyces sp. NBC_01795]WSS13065.1 VOC family protein [Streptomyces sp. NBC_01186]WSS41848.1 VOC family protein [Streptomyces sp. NBC_01187]
MAEKKRPRVGGIVLGSTDPARLWEWYRAAFAPQSEKTEETGAGDPTLGLELGGTYLIFESRDDVGRKSVEPGRLLVNFEVENIRGLEKHLTTDLNARWVREVENVDENVLLGTLEDPDGNYVQIIEMTGDGAGTGE